MLQDRDIQRQFFDDIAKMLVDLAPEIETEYDDWTDCEWEYPYGSDPEYWELHTDDGEPFMLVCVTTEGTETVQTKRAVTNAPPSKCHPAEYESHEATVFVEIVWYPGGDGLNGETHMTIRQEGGAPTAPDPEPYNDI